MRLREAAVLSVTEPERHAALMSPFGSSATARAGYARATTNRCELVMRVERSAAFPATSAFGKTVAVFEDQSEYCELRGRRSAALALLRWLVFEPLRGRRPHFADSSQLPGQTSRLSPVGFWVRRGGAGLGLRSDRGTRSLRTQARLGLFVEPRRVEAHNRKGGVTGFYTPR